MTQTAGRRARSDHRWNLRSCARHGHLTYAVEEPALRERLCVATAQGEAWRCLRCGSYALGMPNAAGAAEDAPVPLRGRALRDAFIIRLLAAERFLRGLILLAAAYGVWKFDGSKDALHRVFREYLPQVSDLAHRIGFDVTDAAPTRFIDRAFNASHHTLMLIALGVLAYGLLECLEGFGLWIMRRWGEYVAVIGTSVFLPYEIYELVDKVSALRVGALLVNVAAVLWLVWSKHLFGVRGGRQAFERERESESLVQVEQAAAG